MDKNIWSHNINPFLIIELFKLFSFYCLTNKKKSSLKSLPTQIECIKSEIEKGLGEKSIRYYDPKIPNSFSSHTTQKMKFSIKDFFSKCDQLRRKLRIWSHSLKKSLMENFIFLCSHIITFENMEDFKHMKQRNFVTCS